MTNYTCLSNVKQLQSDLSRTRLTCGLDIIKNEDQCQKWIHKNAHVYTDYATKQRLQNCDTYFDEFPVAARRPVILKKLSNYSQNCTFFRNARAYSELANSKNVLFTKLLPISSVCTNLYFGMLELLGEAYCS